MSDTPEKPIWKRLLPPPLPLETCPAMAALLWLFVGILPPVLASAGWLHPAVAATAGPATTALLLPLTPRHQRKYAAFLPLGLLLTLLHLWAPWQSYRQQLPRRECGAQIEGVVADPAFAAESLPALAPPPNVRVSLTALRFASDQPWIPCSGTVILRRFKEKTSNGQNGQNGGARPLPSSSGMSVMSDTPTVTPVPLPYGTRIRATGAFAMPDPPLFPGDFDYGLYLRTIGIQHEFLAIAPEEVVAPCSAWNRPMAACYELRDRALERIAAGLEKSDSKTTQMTGRPAAGAPGGRTQLLAGIIFNYCSGMDPTLRTQFLRSGTIHIFSVGGIHVVILGSLLLLMLKLCRVPFRWRHAALPLFLGLYVLMTGTAPPAVRAWVMISFWSVSRAWLLPSSTLNTIAASALFLLLWNPLQIAQTGFIFSFTLVFFLIYGWETTSRWRDAMLEKDRWRPMACRPWWGGLYRHALDLAAGSLLGWLASAGLIAWFNARLIPSAFWINIGIGVTTWLVLALSLLKLLFGWIWHGADASMGWLLGQSLDATCSLAGIGSQAPGSLAIPHPNLCTVLLFYAALIAALSTALKPRLRRAAAVLTLCVPLTWLCAGALRTPQLAVFAGNGVDAPAVVLERPHQPPLVVNSGDFRLARSLAQWLMLRGHDEAATLVLANPNGAKPAAALLGAASAQAVVQAAPATGPGWRELRTAATADGTAWHLLKPDAAQTVPPFENFITLSGPTETRLTTITDSAPDQPLRLTLTRRLHAGTDLCLTDASGHILLASRYFPLAEKPLFLQLPLE